MPDAVYADPSERLPWLPNAAPQTARPQSRSPAPRIAAAGVVVALAAGTGPLLDQRPGAGGPSGSGGRTASAGGGRARRASAGTRGAGHHRTAQAPSGQGSSAAQGDDACRACRQARGRNL